MPAVAKIPPRPKKAEDPVAYELRRMHDCMDQFGKSLGEVHGKVDAVAGDVNDVKLKVAYIEGRQAGIATRVGLPDEDSPKKVRTAFIFQRSWKTATAVIASIVGITVGFVTLYPTLAAIGVAIHHALLGVPG